MKVFLKTVLLTGLPFGFIMGLISLFQHNLKAGVIGGIVGGSVFGIIIGFFVQYQKRILEGTLSLVENEKLIKEGSANHFKNIEGVGGWIYLTNNRFIFKSHPINIQRHELTIPISDIIEAKTSLTLGIIPNGLQLKTGEGKTEKFVVENRKEWVKLIKNLKEN